MGRVAVVSLTALATESHLLLASTAGTIPIIDSPRPMAIL